MENLSYKEMIAINKSIAELYSLQSSENIHRDAFKIIGEVLSFDRASYNKYDSEYKQLSLIQRNDEDRINADRLEDVLQEHVHEHPFWNFKRGVKTISEMTDRRIFKKSGLYNEYYRKLDTESQILCGLDSSGSNLEVYAFSRGPRDFSAKEKLILALLRPHLINAFRNAVERGSFMEEITMLQLAAETEERGTVLLTANGRVKWISRQARYWLSEYFGLPLKEMNRLPHQLKQWTSQEMFSPLLATERKPLVIRHLAPHQDGREKRLIINLVQGTHPQPEQLLAEESGFMLILTEQSSFISEACDLTPREAEVLHWIAKGKTNGSIAIILAISVRTVEKHLEHIFEKLGVETRAAAAAMVQK